LTGNHAGNLGGACYSAGGSSTTVVDSVISGNTADGGGGGVIHGGGGSMKLANVLLEGNESKSQCAAVNANYATVFAVTVAASTAGTGGALCLGPAATLERSTIWSPGAAPQKLHVSPNTTIKSTTIQNGAAAIVNNQLVNSGNGFVPGVAGNSDADPLFVAGPKGKWYLSQLAAGQTKQSPCVDPQGANAILAKDAGAAFGLDFTKLTTRTDGVGDLGTLDCGYHYAP
jgi:hypothetical protein